MENKNLKNGIAEIKKIKMTDSEKNQMIFNIFSNREKQLKPIKSPWAIYTLISLMKRNQLVYYALIPLIIILSGGGVVFASQDSLPNDTLYPIKVKILEPVENTLNFSQKEKAKHQSKLAKTRMIEAQILAEQGKLDIDTEKKINKLLINHADALDHALNKASKNKLKEEEFDDIATNFRAEMNANASILEIIKNQKNETRVTSIQDEIEITSNNHLPETARLRANNIKDTLKQKKIENRGDYKNKKEKIKSLIINADNNIDIKKADEFSIAEDRLIDDTHQKVDEAKKYLEEANKKEEEGDENEAHSLLLDSETSLKEAEILMNSEINFNDDVSEEDYKEELEN